MGLPHEDISRLRDENSSTQLSNRTEMQKLKDEIAELTRFFAARIGELRDEIKKVRLEETGFILELSKQNADRADEIKALQARVTKLEGSVIF